MNTIIVLLIVIQLGQFVLSLILNRSALVIWFSSLSRQDMNGFTAVGSIIFVFSNFLVLVHDMQLSMQNFFVPVLVFPALCAGAKAIVLTCKFVDRQLTERKD